MGWPLLGAEIAGADLVSAKPHAVVGRPGVLRLLCEGETGLDVGL